MTIGKFVLFTIVIFFMTFYSYKSIISIRAAVRASKALKNNPHARQAHWGDLSDWWAIGWIVIMSAATAISLGVFIIKTWDEPLI